MSGRRSAVARKGRTTNVTVVSDIPFPRGVRTCSVAEPPPSPATVRRVVVAVVVGLAVGFGTGPFVGVLAGLLAGWAAGAGLAATWILVTVWGMDADQTQAHATTEDPGRRTARLIAVIGSCASLFAVVVVVIQTKHAPVLMGFVLALIALVSVAASWTLIQADYMLRMARVYYGDPVGGIMFNQDADPCYTDFAYISFGLGVAYQIADTNLTSNEMRRIVIAQSLLGYLFGAVILASVINLVAGLG